MSDVPRGRLVDADAIGLPDVPGLDLPTIEHTYALLDDDASNCRNIGQAELEASYVDNHIVLVEPVQPDPWTLDPASIDSQDLRLVYADLRRYAVRLGSIDVGSGAVPHQYRKAGGIIVPVEAGGLPVLNATNTPRLAALRLNLHEQLRQRAADRLEIAELVSVFAGAISQLGTVGGTRFEYSGQKY